MSKLATQLAHKRSPLLHTLLCAEGAGLGQRHPQLCDPPTLKRHCFSRAAQNQPWPLPSGFSQHPRRWVLSHFLQEN